MSTTLGRVDDSGGKGGTENNFDHNDDNDGIESPVFGIGYDNNTAATSYQDDDSYYYYGPLSANHQSSTTPDVPPSSSSMSSTNPTIIPPWMVVSSTSDVVVFDNIPPFSSSTTTTESAPTKIDPEQVERGRSRAMEVLSQIQQQQHHQASHTPEITPSCSVPETPSSQNVDQAEQIEQGRSRAQDVLSQILQPPPPPPPTSAMTGHDPQPQHLTMESQQVMSNPDSILSYDTDHKTTTTASSFVGHNRPPRRLPPQPLRPILSPEEYAEQRRISFEALERRKYDSLLKNLQYVALKEKQRESGRIQQIQQAQLYEQQLEAQHQQRIEFLQQQRRRQEQHQQNDNGHDSRYTSQDHMVQRTVKRKQQQQKRQRESSSAAIYISGLPVGIFEYNAYGGGGGDSARRDVTNESQIHDGNQLKNTLHQLFGSFGRQIRKIHVYTDKNTGRWKGDALIIYEEDVNNGDNDNNNNIDTGDGESSTSKFVDMVCSQMNGCELPGNVIINAEPSDPFHKKRKSNTNGIKVPPPKLEKEEGQSSHSRSAVENQQQEKQQAEDEPAGEDDDLDDFFASLD